MYWHGRPLEDVHAEVDRVLKLSANGTNRPTKAPEVRTCADDSTAQMRRMPMPGTVSGLPFVCYAWEQWRAAWRTLVLALEPDATDALCWRRTVSR